MLLICWGLHPSAAADCQLRLEVDNVEWRGGSRGGYHVFDPGEYSQTIEFKLHRVGDDCPFFVTFSRGSQGAGQRRAALFGSEALDYQIYHSLEDRTVLKPLPDANANEVLRGVFAPGETVKQLSYTIAVPPEQVKPAGRYSDVLEITAFQGTPDHFLEKDSRTITFSIQVEEVAELSMVGSGAPFDPSHRARNLDFDRLAKGTSKGFDLRVRSNAGYDVVMESESGGVMKNIDPQVSSEIPYSLYLGGSRVNLRGGRQIGLSRANRMTGAGGDQHAVEVVIGETRGAVAGVYRDNITVTVISNQ